MTNRYTRGLHYEAAALARLRHLISENSWGLLLEHPRLGPLEPDALWRPPQKFGPPILIEIKIRTCPEAPLQLAAYRNLYPLPARQLLITSSHDPLALPPDANYTLLDTLHPLKVPPDGFAVWIYNPRGSAPGSAGFEPEPAQGSGEMAQSEIGIEPEPAQAGQGPAA